MRTRPARGGRACVLGALLALLCGANASYAADRWKIGRGPEVFRPGDDLWTTRVGGWFDASYEDNDLSGETRSLNANHVNGFLDTRYRERWQLFFEAEFEYETDLVGYAEEREYEVEQVYARYRHSDALELRAGKFNTPFGIWTPVHWSILMDTIRPPLHEGLRITPEQQNGFGLSGRWLPLDRLGDPELRYTAFAGYGSDSEFLDESGDGWSGGADLRVLAREDRFVGVSYYQQRRDFGPRDRGERSIDLYGQASLPGNLLIRGEYVMQSRDRRVPGASSRDVDLTYLKLRWRFHPKAYLNYRFNWGDDDSGASTVVRRIHTLTLGFQPRPSIRLKLELARHDFRDDDREDFLYWGASIGALF